MLLARIFWKQVKKLWEKAKQGGVILSRPKEYLTYSFLPSFLSWLCKLAVIGIFLAAFAIPVTFESVMWVTGSGSLANVVSFTPGAVGITQATNALALDTCCDVAKSTAVDYSTAQQLITTAWNVLVALVLVVSVFGWKGGKQLVEQSYADAKVKVAEQKAQHAEKKAEKKAEREESGRGRFHRRHDDDAAEKPSSRPEEENVMTSGPEPAYGQSTAWQPERPRLRLFPLIVSWLATGVALDGGRCDPAGRPHRELLGCARRGGGRRGAERGHPAGARRAAVAAHARPRLPARADRGRPHPPDRGRAERHRRRAQRSTTSAGRCSRRSSSRP